MKYKYITKVQETLILSRSYHKNISISVHIFKINVLFFAMQKSSEIKLWVTGKVESSEVETNSLSKESRIYGSIPRIGPKFRLEYPSNDGVRYSKFEKNTGTVILVI